MQTPEYPGQFTSRRTLTPPNPTIKIGGCLLTDQFLEAE